LSNIYSSISIKRQPAGLSCDVKQTRRLSRGKRLATSIMSYCFEDWHAWDSFYTHDALSPFMMITGGGLCPNCPMQLPTLSKIYFPAKLLLQLKNNYFEYWLKFVQIFVTKMLLKFVVCMLLSTILQDFIKSISSWQILAVHSYVVCFLLIETWNFCDNAELARSHILLLQWKPLQ
jgi:hypothetical protein